MSFQLLIDCEVWFNILRSLPVVICILIFFSLRHLIMYPGMIRGAWALHESRVTAIAEIIAFYFSCGFLLFVLVVAVDLVSIEGFENGFGAKPLSAQVCNNK